MANHLHTCVYYRSTHKHVPAFPLHLQLLLRSRTLILALSQAQPEKAIESQLCTMDDRITPWTVGWPCRNPRKWARCKWCSVEGCTTHIPSSGNLVGLAVLDPYGPLCDRCLHTGQPPRYYYIKMLFGHLSEAPWKLVAEYAYSSCAEFAGWRTRMGEQRMSVPDKLWDCYGFKPMRRMPM